MKIFALALVCCAAALAQDKVPVKVSKLETPEKALQLEVVVPAKPDAVWTAFTTSEGLNTWLWKDCTVDLKKGGGWIVHYSPTATGGGTIESLKPGKEIVIHAMAPEQFPEVRRLGTTATFAFEPAGAGTKVTLTQTGW